MGFLLSLLVTFALTYPVFYLAGWTPQPVKLRIHNHFNHLGDRYRRF